MLALLDGRPRRKAQVQMHMQLHALQLRWAAAPAPVTVASCLLVFLARCTTSFNDLEAWHTSMAMCLRRSGISPWDPHALFLQTSELLLSTRSDSTVTYLRCML